MIITEVFFIEEISIYDAYILFKKLCSYKEFCDTSLITKSAVDSYCRKLKSSSEFLKLLFEISNINAHKLILRLRDRIISLLECFLNVD